MGGERRILSAWLPRLPTDTALRGRDGREQPFALFRDERGRLTVAAVNAAAGAQGIRPGMPLADARAMLPALRTEEE
ncbi:hypothetical protein [Azospirillum sp. SYSU D00513]|uniref:hypothetical protein n=1 Tax=Azospirillum sp. SYSU D00513 TaxID=2812561 RepID=UPI001FFE94AC|nr:hypothetical protein [Azospirillum sp. SYSU D00513]